MSYCEIGHERPAAWVKTEGKRHKKTRSAAHDERRTAMDRLENSVAVTLSDDLLATLRREAEALGVPLEWVVASLVADTLDGAGSNPEGLAA